MQVTPTTRVRSVDSAQGCGKIGIEKVCWNRVGPAGAGREELMKIRTRLAVLVVAAAVFAWVSVPARAQPQKDAEAIAIGEKDIGGVVSSPQGREAGVWVIAETTELPTQFRRIVRLAGDNRLVTAGSR
jgi:hypothetical protein